MIRRFGFIIDGNKIYDTQLLSYKKGIENIDGNLIYFMEPSGYKRLYRFEPLLEVFNLDKVFLLLKNNTNIVKSRSKEIDESKKIDITNMSVLENYPPSYLTTKKFYYYKICQELKQKLR